MANGTVINDRLRVGPDHFACPRCFNVIPNEDVASNWTICRDCHKKSIKENKGKRVIDAKRTVDIAVTRAITELARSDGNIDHSDLMAKISQRVGGTKEMARMVAEALFRAQGLNPDGTEPTNEEDVGTGIFRQREVQGYLKMLMYHIKGDSETRAATTDLRKMSEEDLAGILRQEAMAALKENADFRYEIFMEFLADPKGQELIRKMKNKASAIDVDYEEDNDGIPESSTVG